MKTLKPLYGIIAKKYDHPYEYGIATSLLFSDRALACAHARKLAAWSKPLVISSNYLKYIPA